MIHSWDEFSKSLAEESLPRRETLRRLGAVLAGAVLAPLGLNRASAASKGRPTTDPCVAFCQCKGKQRNDCLAVCHACDSQTWRLSGSCGAYVCCRQPGPLEYGPIGARDDGACLYACYTDTEFGDAVYCGGTCTFLGYDPNNCGTCGNVCGESTPYCSNGQCWDANCGGADLWWDSSNCGSCGNVCPWGTACSFGVCEGVCPDC